MDRLARWLDELADPIPNAEELLQGIGHKDDAPEHRDELWELLRALGSRKVHYLPELMRDFLGASGAKGPSAFSHAFPDAVFSDGWRARTDQEFQEAVARLPGDGTKECAKHELARHDGEVQYWGTAGNWRPFPAERKNRTRQ